MPGRIQFTDMQLTYPVPEPRKNSKRFGHCPVALVRVGEIYAQSGIR